MVGLVNAEDNNNDVQTVITEVTDENKAKEIESESSPELDKSYKTNVKKQSGHSVKMIIGGQSEGGVAKQITLPVKD